MSRLSAADPLRLALGTLTILPTPPPRSVDRRVASWAMTLAPLVGALLAVAGGALLWLLGWGPAALPDPVRLLPGMSDAGPRLHPFLVAALTVGLLAVLTRAMHLDGLADTADGLGSGKPAEQALQVMRRGDVGPFGVVTLVLVLLVQVLALGGLLAEGLGPAGLLLALVVSRLVLPLACSRGVPAARADGLGRAVAGSVGRRQLGVAALLTLGVLVVFPLAGPGDPAPGLPVLPGLPGTLAGALGGALAVALVALAGAAAVVRRAVRRLGGVTGDVLGAAVETAFTVTLVVLSLAT